MTDNLAAYKAKHHELMAATDTAEIERLAAEWDDVYFKLTPAEVAESEAWLQAQRAA